MWCETSSISFVNDFKRESIKIKTLCFWIGTVHIYQNESSSPQNRKRCLHFKFYYILAHCKSSGRYCPSYLLIWLNSHKHHQIFTPSCCVHLIKTDVEIENVLAWIRSTVLLVSVTAVICDCWQTPLIVLALIMSQQVLAPTLCPTLLMLSSTVNILQCCFDLP